MYIRDNKEEVYISNINITDSYTGIYIRDSNRVIIRRINCYNNSYAGIDIQNNTVNIYNITSSLNEIGINVDTSNGIINYSDLSKNSKGIKLNGYNIFNISHNYIYNNSYGILINGNSKIFYNNIYNNTYGLYFDYNAQNNLIYLNNFNNTNNVKFSQFNMQFFNSTSAVSYSFNNSNFTNSLGNYWSDFGWENSDSNNDGIWDNPYTLATNNTDYRPLTHPFEYYTINEIKDTTPPTINIISPIEKVYNYLEIWINASADENISSWWYSLDNNANISFTPNIKKNFTEGEHLLKVYANDT